MTGIVIRPPPPVIESTIPAKKKAMLHNRVCILNNSVFIDRHPPSVSPFKLPAPGKSSPPRQKRRQEYCKTAIAVCSKLLRLSKNTEQDQRPCDQGDRSDPHMPRALCRLLRRYRVLYLSLHRIGPEIHHIRLCWIVSDDI